MWDGDAHFDGVACAAMQKVRGLSRATEARRAGGADIGTADNTPQPTHRRPWAHDHAVAMEVLQENVTRQAYTAVNACISSPVSAYANI